MFEKKKKTVWEQESAKRPSGHPHVNAIQIVLSIRQQCLSAIYFCLLPSFPLHFVSCFWNIFFETSLAHVSYSLFGFYFSCFFFSMAIMKLYFISIRPKMREHKAHTYQTKMMMTISTHWCVSWFDISWCTILYVLSKSKSYISRAIVHCCLFA